MEGQNPKKGWEGMDMVGPGRADGWVCPHVWDGCSFERRWGLAEGTVQGLRRRARVGIEDGMFFGTVALVSRSSARSVKTRAVENKTEGWRRIIGQVEEI